MKNLLIYINPVQKQFSKEHEDLTKIQIDNSLQLGWKTQDIMLVTNFPYDYRGVAAIVVGDYEYRDEHRSTKIQALIELYNKGFIKDDELYWFHDHDAFQLVPLGEVKIDKDAAFTTHGAYSPLWNAGSFFFKKSARDIFETTWEYMNLKDLTEQYALTFIWENNISDINSRYQLLNITYNIGIYRINANIADAEKPVKVLHFHPHKKKHLDLFRQLLPMQLMTIFNKYGIY